MLFKYCIFHFEKSTFDGLEIRRSPVDVVYKYMPLFAGVFFSVFFFRKNVARNN